MVWLRGAGFCTEKGRISLRYVKRRTHKQLYQNQDLVWSFRWCFLSFCKHWSFLWWWLTATEISQIIFKPSFSAFTIYAGTDKSKTSFPLIVNLLQGWTCKALENTMSALENTLVPIAEDIHLVRVRPLNIFDNIAAWTHNLSSVSIPLVCSSFAGLMAHTDAYYPQLRQPLSLFVYIQSHGHSTGWDVHSCMSTW